MRTLGVAVIGLFSGLLTGVLIGSLIPVLGIAGVVVALVIDRRSGKES